MHLVKDNIQMAIDTFEKICDKYKATPWKNELACRLIQKEDAANLQKLTDLSTNIHGEVNSLYDLVFAFVECGRIRQARKILETPGLRTRPHRIDNACERYKNEGLVEPLEGLIEATKNLAHIDRMKIFYNLLLSYNKANEAEKALGLWTKMQEEGVIPSDAFLIKLAELLKKNKIEIPFVVPQTEQQKNKNSKLQAAAKAAEDSIKPKAKTAKETTKTQPTAAQTVSNLTLLRKALNEGNVDLALQYKNQLTPSESLSLIDKSHLIEQLVKADRITEASKYVEELLNEKRHPLPKIFKFYLNKIANAGDVNAMQRIGELMNDEQKRLVSFDNRYCHANIVAGKTEEYFKQLSDEIAAAKSAEEAAKLAEKFPRGGALGILQKYPEMIPQCKYKCFLCF